MVSIICKSSPERGCAVANKSSYSVDSACVAKMKEKGNRLRCDVGHPKASPRPAIIVSWHNIITHAATVFIIYAQHTKAPEGKFLNVSYEGNCLGTGSSQLVRQEQIFVHKHKVCFNQVAIVTAAATALWISRQ